MRLKKPIEALEAESWTKELGGVALTAD